MRYFKVKLLGTISLFLGLSFSIYASDGPSIEKTQDYISDKATLRYKINDVAVTRSVKFSGKCVMDYRESTKWRDSEPSYLTQNANLKMLDPSTVRLTDSDEGMATVRTDTTEFKEVVRLTHHDNKYNKDHVWFTVLKRDGDRTVKAMMHLIEICGGIKQSKNASATASTKKEKNTNENNTSRSALTYAPKVVARENDGSLKIDCGGDISNLILVFEDDGIYYGPESASSTSLDETVLEACKRKYGY